MIVKICGITNLEEGLAALEAGADMLGFNFYPPSPRYVPPDHCAELIGGLNRQLGAARSSKTFAGVFVNKEPAQVTAILERCRLDLAQLCGDEPSGWLAQLGERAFKALRPKDPADLERVVREYPMRSGPPAWLVDAHHPGEYGGTGRVADWSLAAGLAKTAPILLAGGLNPENVVEAVRQIRPWGVDVASGVEAAPGRKDPQKMKRFVEAVRKANQEIVQC